MTLKYKKIIRKTWDNQKNIPKCPDKGSFEITHGNSTYFVVDGKLHRTDGPAWIFFDGTQYYYRHGKLHREDGPALIRADGTHYYYQHGKCHRTDGPAAIYIDGTQGYYQNDQLHRLDGPAAIWVDGSQHYFIFGRHYPQKEGWELKVLQLSLKEQIV